MGFGDASIGQHSLTIDEAHTRDIIRRSLDMVKSLKLPSFQPLDPEMMKLIFKKQR